MSSISCHLKLNRWSTVIFDFTIQTLPDHIYDLFDERIRHKIQTLEEILHSHQIDSNCEDNLEQIKEEKSAFKLDRTQEPLSPSENSKSVAALTSVELSNCEKEYCWFHNFHHKIQEVRKVKGIPASVKWKRLKSDPLSNERTTLNFLKSIEDRIP